MRLECGWKVTVIATSCVLAVAPFAGVSSCAQQVAGGSRGEVSPPSPEPAYALAAAQEEAPGAEEGIQGEGFAAGAIKFFKDGGVFMWPLLACLLIGLAVMLERLWTLMRARINTKQFVADVLTALREHGVEEAKAVCVRTHGPIAAILHSGLLRAGRGTDAIEKAIESAGAIEMNFLERGLLVLTTVASVAPLLGFLGTVSGMIHAFEAIAAAEQVSVKLVAAGVAEALITTLAGLCIAIPIQSAHNYFVSIIDRFVIEMEEASVDLVDTMVDMEAGRSVRA